MARKSAAVAKPEPVPVQWPAQSVEMWPLDKIKPYENNPRTHPRDQVEALARDMLRDGVTMPILVDEDGVIIAGHGRRLAAAKNQFKTYPVVVARGWTEAQKKAARLTDNQRAIMSTWDEKLLRLEVTSLRALDYPLDALGWPKLELEGILDIPSTGDRAEIGRLLEMVNVTVADPEHQVETGDHYVLSKRHHLFCAGVIDGWATWAPALTPGSLFCPYPGSFIPLSVKAADHALIMVQPDTYIAGHILDRYAEVHTLKAIAKVTT